LVTGRTAKKAEEFVQNLMEAPGAEDEQKLATLFADDDAQEAVAQCFRTAMESLCPSA
jgi:hypothetical protein